jgi:hypothetical protein
MAGELRHAPKENSALVAKIALPIFAGYKLKVAACLNSPVAGHDLEWFPHPDSLRA